MKVNKIVKVKNLSDDKPKKTKRIFPDEEWARNDRGMKQYSRKRMNNKYNELS